MRTEIWSRLRKEVIDLYRKLDTIDVHNNYIGLLNLKGEILTLQERYSDIYQEINQNLGGSSIHHCLQWSGQQNFDFSKKYSYKYLMPSLTL